MGRVIELSQRDAGRTVQASVGDEVDITLDENASTGYLWTCSTSSSAVLQDLPTPDQAAPTAPGAQRLRHFRFRAATQGQVVVRCARKRPWEDTALDEFSIDVTVQG